MANTRPTGVKCQGYAHRLHPPRGCRAGEQPPTDYGSRGAFRAENADFRKLVQLYEEAIRQLTLTNNNCGRS